MTIPIHRNTDPRTCGATTVVSGQSTVFANNLLVSVDGDPNSHGGGALSAACGQVFANNIMVVNNTPDGASADALCIPLGGAHCGPSTAGGSPDVFVGDEAPGASSLDPDPDTTTFYNEINQPYRQDGVSAYTQAIHDTDDEGAPSDTGGTSPQSNGTVPLTSKQTYVAGAAKEENVDVKTPPTKDPVVAVSETRQPNSASGYTYDDINAATSFPESFQLSPNFTLGALTSRARVSKYPLRSQSTNGRTYTEKEIVCNLRDLCYNVLEPLKQMYPSIVVNSGFRHASNGKSQHERGQAADMALSSTDSNADAAWTVAQAIVNSNIPYDQFIFEQNNTIWFHVSYDKARGSQRGMVMSKPRGQDKPTVGLQKAH